jgi:hypothetical protein
MNPRKDPELEKYDARVRQIVARARRNFLLNRESGKSGWDKPGWDPLVALQMELAEVEEARSEPPDYHLTELGDAFNFLVFELEVHNADALEWVEVEKE